MNVYKFSDVFVPGGVPEHTYISRTQHRLEETLRLASQNLCKLVTVTGPTKSGKTVLAKKLYPDTDAVWLDGGSFNEEQQLWTEIASQLDGFTTREVSESTGSTAGVKGSVEGTLKIPFIQGKTSVTPSYSGSTGKTTTQGIDRPSKTAALSALRTSGRTLVLDDFHYLDREMQASIVRALKPLICAGQGVICLSIPHRRYDAVKVNRDMIGRILSINIPDWTRSELAEIPQIGFALLNAKIGRDILDTLSIESLGSPHLMQEFCREICYSMAFLETTPNQHALDIPTPQMEAIFRRVAENTSPMVFERLARGPRQRSRRKSRRLREGGTADIYRVVLKAISEIRPGMQPIEYDEIRAALDLVLHDPLPQLHEVSRVLQKMTEISSDEASPAVIYWEKEDRRLHITDPFLAFFLRWGG